MRQIHFLRLVFVWLMHLIENTFLSDDGFTEEMCTRNVSFFDISVSFTVSPVHGFCVQTAFPRGEKIRIEVRQRTA